jgi:hypothetical protein
VDEYFRENKISKNYTSAMVIKTIILLSLYILPFVYLLVFKPGVGVSLAIWSLMGFALAGVGMVAEAKISLKRGLISNSEFDRLKNLIKRFGLPIAIKLSGKRIELIDAVSKDKKKRNGKIKMYLLNGIGKSLIYEVGFDEIGVALDDLS